MNNLEYLGGSPKLPSTYAFPKRCVKAVLLCAGFVMLALELCVGQGALPPKERNGQHAEKPGIYSMAIKALTPPVIRSGEYVSFHVFFTGYGEIGYGKVFWQPPLGVFDPDSSRVFTSIWYDTATIVINGERRRMIRGYGWGSKEEKKLSENAIIGMTAGVTINDIRYSLFFDDKLFAPPDSVDPLEKRIPTISTETITPGPNGRSELDRAPLTLKLKTYDNLRPGNYKINIVFTYYNGERWQADSKDVEFRVQSYLERHEERIGKWGTIFGGILGGAAIIRLVYDIFKLGKKAVRWLTRKVRMASRWLRTRILRYIRKADAS